LENLKGRDHSEDLSLDGNVIFRMDLREIVWEVVDWMHLTQDTDQWLHLVSTIMHLPNSIKGEKFLD
jgi:hypothetical protein